MRSPNPLIAFLHIAKTAGTTLHYVLRRTYGTGYVVVTKRYSGRAGFDAADLERLRRRYPRLRALGGHGVHPLGDLVEADPDLRFLTMLRDPAARCASHYAHNVRRGHTTLPFLQWIESELNQDYQTRRLAGDADAGEAIRLLDEKFLFVGLVEEFDESLRLLRNQLPELALPVRPAHRNQNPFHELRDEVLADPRSRDAISATHQEDLRLYEYARVTIWPKQQAETSTIPPPRPSELKAAARERVSLAKERLVLGIPRRLAKAGLKLGKPL